MNRVLQIMMRPGDSTAIVGRSISEVIQEFQFDNLYLQGNKTVSITDGRCRSIVMGFGKRTISGLFRYFAVLILLARFAKNKPELIIAHRYKCVDISDLLSRFYNIPLVVVVHGVGEFDRSYRTRKLNSLIQRGVTVVCVSKHVESYVRGCLQKKVISKMGDNQILTIENSIDFSEKSREQFTREEAQKKLGLDAKNSFLIGYVGRLANVKGVTDIVKAAMYTKEENVHFVIMGDGPLSTELKDIFKASGKDNLSFTGFVQDAFQYFRAFDIVVLPSRSEGFPLTLLEAVAARTPFITTDIEVYKEVVGESDFFYAPGDISALCEKISSMIKLHRKGELEGFGDAQGTRISDRYPFSEFVKSYSDLLRGIVQ